MSSPLLELYTSPDQLLPVASIVAAVVGLLFIFWSKIVETLRRVVGISKRSPGERKTTYVPGKRSTRQH
jgi:hypothetical protein